MRLELTAMFRKDPEGGYVASVMEVPGAITQGDTLEEARENLHDAVMLLIETNRMRSEAMVAGGEVIREPLLIQVG
ncbi:MAG: type II toxin-antitoxin system HicB family antitoxin [Longimicrobiaceae bacterium]